MRIADRWFEVIAHDDGITQLVEPYVHRIIRCNIWHVRGRDRDPVVDTGVGVASLADELSPLLARPTVCVATHVHYDHVGCLHEFEHRLTHPVGAAQMTASAVRMPLRWSAFQPEMAEAARKVGYGIDRDEMLVASPHRSFDIDAFVTVGAPATEVIDEGAVIDLGDRRFEVLHLPGHTDDSIGLWEADTRTLLAGDAIYGGPLIDILPESCIDDYVATMRRLRDLRADVAHAGHDPSFGRERLFELADAYLRRTPESAAPHQPRTAMTRQNGVRMLSTIWSTIFVGG
jgi:glyoxylase-like metal-dependent hydrolase (beta-lactamase superfamily II)